MPSTRAEVTTSRPARPALFVAGSAELSAQLITLRGAEGKHASTVRRLAPGERADVTDGAGAVAECLVTAARPGEVDLSVRTLRAYPRPDPLLTVVQAIPKGERGELAVELLTEAGTDVIVPWAADRCVAVWRGERAGRARARWSSAAERAAKQSRRPWFPTVADQAGLPEVVRRVQAAELAVLLEPDSPSSLADIALPATGQIVLVIGPEGGVSAGEAAALGDAGAVSARIGPTILRASSAGVVAASVVLSRTARWA
jgi:16S rRNA (uracil1498-N3)-methyltransferase